MSEVVPEGSAARRPEPTFAEFVTQVRELMDGTANAKGYNKTDVDGPNPLFSFVHEMGGNGHALGEIVYKARRYAAKRDQTDLLKIAAWAFLLWRHMERKS